MKKVRSFKRMTGFILVLAAVFILACRVYAVTTSEAKESIVMVMGNNGGMGSGFAIGEVGKPVQYIVTNNHVVKGDLGNTTAVVYFSYASDEKVLANVYVYDAEKDIAILKLPEPTDKRNALVLCPMKYVDPDDDFAALGYPGNQVTDWPKYNTSDITVTKGGIKKTDRLDGQDVYMLDLEITNGNSGGPLLNSKNEVVGVNTKKEGYADAEYLNSYAIAIDEVLSFIDRDKIPVSIHSGIGVLPFVIGGGVIVVIIIILIVVLIRKKPGDDSSKSIAQPVTGEVTGNEGQFVPNRKMGEMKPGRSVRIIAVGGPLTGKKYSAGAPVKIGRDSSRCAIAFPVNTKGVSGVHCELGFDGKVCYVKDLSSTYGTYLLNGAKLNANQPVILNSGDKFYLASPENTFEVRF